MACSGHGRGAGPRRPTRRYGRAQRGGVGEPYSSGIPALRRPAIYVVSTNARIFGALKHSDTLKDPLVFRRATLEKRSSLTRLLASTSSAAARSVSPLRA